MVPAVVSIDAQTIEKGQPGGRYHRGQPNPFDFFFGPRGQDGPEGENPREFRSDAGGSGLRPLSHGALSEFTPTMMEDGRILYNRWEYVYKGIAAIQPVSLDP